MNALPCAFRLRLEGAHAAAEAEFIADSPASVSGARRRRCGRERKQRGLGEWSG
jgi:hypothetical protein